jgi:hypothetical protein
MNGLLFIDDEEGMHECSKKRYNELNTKKINISRL